MAPQLEADVFSNTDGVDAVAIGGITLDVIWEEAEGMKGGNTLIRT